MSNLSPIKYTVLNVLTQLPRSASGRIRLTALRNELDGEVSREMQDKALIALQNDGIIVLYKDDNTYALKAADKKAAVIVAGNERHLVYLT